VIKLLQVGDVIYEEIHNCLNSKLCIDRVTEKYAFVKTIKFHREYDDKSSWLDEVNTQKWNTTYYYIETPELKSKWYITVMLSYVKHYKDWENLSIEKLKEIYNIIKSEKAIKKDELIK
jgi:hypothetical protein